MTTTVFDLLDELSAPTDFKRSWEPPVIQDAKSNRAAKRYYLLTQFKRARKLGMGISTVQIMRCLSATVAPARVLELIREGWRIVNKGRCNDGSDIYFLEDDEKGDPIVKLLGWEGSLWEDLGPEGESHKDKQALKEEERESLDRHMRRAMAQWVSVHKPAWYRDYYGRD